MDERKVTVVLRREGTHRGLTYEIAKDDLFRKFALEETVPGNALAEFDEAEGGAVALLGVAQQPRRNERAVVRQNRFDFGA